MNKLISILPESMGGTACLAGTQVPVATLFEHLRAGGTTEEFLNGFPSVSRGQLLSLLELAEKLVIEDATTP